MSFMKPQVAFGWWLQFEDKQGMRVIDVDKPERHSFAFRHAKQYADGEVIVAAYVEKWAARLSADGYLDCTDWVLFGSQKEAAEYLLNEYYDLPDDEMSPDQMQERSELTQLMEATNGR